MMLQYVTICSSFIQPTICPAPTSPKKDPSRGGARVKENRRYELSLQVLPRSVAVSAARASASGILESPSFSWELGVERTLPLSERPGGPTVLRRSAAEGWIAAGFLSDG